MSTRDYFCSIASIDPIRDAVASGDDALVEAVISLRTQARMEEFGEESQEDAACFRNIAESMIKCDSPPALEPGCWNYVFEYIARHQMRRPDKNLPFNEGWKHYECWKPYRKLVASHVPPQSMTILEHLEHGRPLCGRKVDHDGCVFAWLTPDEVKELTESLACLPDSVIADPDLADFHSALVESLRLITSESSTLLLSAY